MTLLPVLRLLSKQGEKRKRDWILLVPVLSTSQVTSTTFGRDDVTTILLRHESNGLLKLNNEQPLSTANITLKVERQKKKTL